MSSLEDAMQLQVCLPVDLLVLVVYVDTLSDQDTFVNVRQAARQEGAELYEVVDGDAFFFCLAGTSILLRLAIVLSWQVVTAGYFHLAFLVLVGQPILLLFFLELRHVLLRHGAHGGKLRTNLVDLVTLERMLFTDLLDFFITKHAASLSLLVLICAFCGRCRLFTFFLLNFEGGTASPVLSELF